ncbi:MAG: hypothetical protein R2796_10530 [Chitinophagaceae bacterium]|nr:hypothetical protein [Chitinophagaceae bacterium]
MKKIFLILLITVLTKNINAQSGVPDTLSYLQSIVANKNAYIGQPFSTLYNDLQIQVKHFWPNASIHYNKTKETSTQFAFYFPLLQEDIYLTYPCIEVYWQTPLDKTQSDIIRGTNNNRGQWNTPAYNFYRNAIIADIQLIE